MGKLDNGITVLARRINRVNGSTGASLIQFHQYTNCNANRLKGRKQSKVVICVTYSLSNNTVNF